MYILLSDHKE